MPVARGGDMPTTDRPHPAFHPTKMTEKVGGMAYPAFHGGHTEQRPPSGLISRGLTMCRGHRLPFDLTDHRGLKRK